METAKKLPVVVNPHGGPWARDTWGYNPEVQFLAARGYAVLQMNFRGSTGYGRKFTELGYKQWGQTMQNDITDGVEWLIKQGIADPKRIAIYGASYGGYATLAGVTFTPDLYACAIDYVGVANLFTFMQTIPPYWKPLLDMMYEMVGDPVKDKEMMEKYSPVFHSLAKWKRYALDKYGFSVGEGLYTDMNAIRRDEETDNIHSIFVDQWDWEKIITKEDRNIETLKETVRTVYKVLRKTEKYMSIKYDYIQEILPKDIFFITTQELEDVFPDVSSPKEREYYIAKAKGAVCIMQIGDVLENGERHDGRAPDYDDWSLNADIVVYYPVLDIALELSSMGIRVDKDALLSQLEKAGCPERAELPFQKAIIEEKLPYTIGGGIGQSRICMFFLRKAHIGEVQSSMWPEEVVQEATAHEISLL